MKITLIIFVLLISTVAFGQKIDSTGTWIPRAYPEHEHSMISGNFTVQTSGQIKSFDELYCEIHKCKKKRALVRIRYVGCFHRHKTKPEYANAKIHVCRVARIKRPRKQFCREYFCPQCTKLKKADSDYWKQIKNMPTVVYGKWALTRYTETFGGETYNRPIAGVKNYEPKTDSSYKEMDQGDSVSVYEFNPDNTYTLLGQNGKVIGKWKTDYPDDRVTLYDNQSFNALNEPLPKSNNTFDLRLISKDGLFLVLSSYDSELKATHKLYYKKDQGK